MIPDLFVKIFFVSVILFMLYILLRMLESNKVIKCFLYINEKEDELVWQHSEENVWVFGKSVRGIVREKIAEVFLEEESQKWIWTILDFPEKTGEEYSLVQAIEKIERELL